MIKHWTNGVTFDDNAREQLTALASLSFVRPHVAVMPDVHLGIGCSVGSVVPTIGAIIPAAVGVDIGCGMTAVRTTLTSADVSDSGKDLFEALSRAVPHGSSKGSRDVGAWHDIPSDVGVSWGCMLDHQYKGIIEKHPKCATDRVLSQLGTLGGGNHFVEVCLDEQDHVWLMLHSGSRGVGNKIGSYFIELARNEMTRLDRHLPNKDLAYLSEGTEHFADYVDAIGWAQRYASCNRQIMLDSCIAALRFFYSHKYRMPLTSSKEIVSCHHNYVSREQHFGEDVYITRKGAVSAKLGQLGIIPGSMGAKSFIVRGKGNADSFHSCSHGAGRVMSRGQAKKNITLEEHARDTAGVACRKDASVIDESPRAYKDIDAVMAAQSDLVEIVHTLKQIVCVKG